jgi:hypothetical protein
MVRMEPDYFKKGAGVSMMGCVDAIVMADAREVWEIDAKF